VIVHSGEECLAFDLDNDGFVRKKLFSALSVSFRDLTVKAVRFMRLVFDCKRLPAGCRQALREGILAPVRLLTPSRMPPSADLFTNRV
jgi:hypothetical protein